MPQKRKKHNNFTGCSMQQNDNNRNIKTKQTERHSERKMENILFTNDELQEVKTILKRKHLAKTPAIISATVLNKCKTIESILKKGDDVNEHDEIGATALIWGVRTKTLEAIKLLLKVENICLKTETYDHILFVALNSVNWNENEFYNLWTNVKASSYPVGVNILSKDGRSMLHYAVEREWMGFINILISENADINIQDINGLTPIMLACVKQNLKIIEYFIEHTIDITAEDRNGLTALCFIISTSRKINNTNFPIERFLDDIQDTTVKNYIKTRLELLTATTPSSNESSQILMAVFKYLITREDTFEYLLETKIFEKFKEAITADLSDIPKLRFMLTLAWELYKQESKRKEIISAFISQGCLEAFLLIAQKYKLNSNESIGKTALKAIVNIAITNDNGKLWLEIHYKSVNDIFKVIYEEDLYKILNIKDEIWIYDSLKTHQFVECLNILRDGGIICGKKTNVTQQLEENFMKNVKKSKRRTKAFKVKLQKMKNAELVERLNTKKSLIVKPSENETNNWECDVPDKHTEYTTYSEDIKCDDEDILKDELPSDYRKYGPYCKIYVNSNEDNKSNYTEDECVLVNAIKNSILKDDNKNTKRYEKPEKFTGKKGDWRSTITNLPFVNGNSVTRDVIRNVETLNATPKIYSQLLVKDADMSLKLVSVIEYLTSLLENIIQEYNIQWQIDSELESKICDNDAKEADVERIVSKFKEEKIETLKTVFYDMISHIKVTVEKDYTEAINLANKLEKLLLNHEIRGKTIKEDVLANETVEVSVDYLNNYSFIPNYTLENYMEDVLNKKRDVSENIVINIKEAPENKREDSYKADLVYLQEIMQLPPKKTINTQKLYESQMETMKYSYHLVGSIMKICDSDEETSFEDSVHKLSSNNSLSGCSKNMACDIKSRENSRWCSLVRSLELMKDCQTLLNGNVRISCQRKRTSHAISTGGNFTPVELGLDKFNAPLAVKRIPQGSSICTMIKDLISELLDLRHTNILHYCVCDYDKNELILGTSLCEYNIGQYLMLMKQKKMASLTTLDIVTQFLNGLHYLHGHSPPIIHGNLKPSNIFIDLNGNVKLAEFGIHHALFKFKEAPNSSVIWFSTETYNKFNDTSIMECSLESDIQVTGMLIHFIITGGTHAFGVETKEILKNLEKATPKLICNDIELQDLLTWMLLVYPTERPTIQQVLSHVYFWSMDKKWQFILTCSGVTSSGVDLLMDLDSFHFTIDQISHKENIKGNWVQVMKRLIPNLTNSDDDDSPTGLLKFIRSCFKNRPPPIEFTSDFERCNFFIKSFPTLALSLYRMLENTEWLNHSVFLIYTVQK